VVWVAAVLVVLPCWCFVLLVAREAVLSVLSVVCDEWSGTLTTLTGCGAAVWTVFLLAQPSLVARVLAQNNQRLRVTVEANRLSA
jgi:phosphatidylglycerophosphate synthase